MRFLLSTCLFSLFALKADSQDFSGQWKGEFIDKSSSYGNISGEKCDYVLDLEINGSSVSGS